MGKNRTGFLLQVVGMHAQIKKVVKEPAFCSEQILEVLAHTYHAHFQLPVYTTTESFHARIPLLRHPDPIPTTTMCGADQVHIEQGFQDN